jgi:hypothetical protein
MLSRLLLVVILSPSVEAYLVEYPSNTKSGGKYAS